MTQNIAQRPARQGRRSLKRAKAVVLAAPAAPQGLPVLIERVAASVTDIDGLTKLLALKREMEADADRRAFDSDFAALQAEVGRVAANRFDPQKHRAYADLNALIDMVGPLAAARGFTITYTSEPSTVPNATKVTMRVGRNGAWNETSVDVPMDGVGMRGNANMSPAQATLTITYGRKQALLLGFNLTVDSGGQRPPEPQQRRLPGRRIRRLGMARIIWRS